MDRKTSLTILIAIFLASCAKVEVPPTPSSTSIPTASPIPPPTPTSTPIPTASPIPSPTLTATPTEDPLAGAPEGATAKDANGNWTRPLVDAAGAPVLDENGKAILETYLTYAVGPNGETISGWHRPLGEINAWETIGNDGFPVRWYIADGVPGGHIKEIIRQSVVSSDDRSSLNSAINPIIGDRLGLANGQKPIDLFENGQTFTYSVYEDVNGVQTLVTKDITIDKDTGIKVFIVPPEDLEPFVGEKEKGGVSLATDNISLRFYSKLVGVDADDELVFVIASPVALDKLSEKRLRWMLFLNLARFIGTEDQSVQNLNTYTSILGNHSGHLRANGKPDVEIIWNK
ncbi:MAG: hypothetical protein FJZ86_03845 [Chloroflexi bacterium]|nr:hypothetical protein [Chloroflexota bacterium]